MVIIGIEDGGRCAGPIDCRTGPIAAVVGGRRRFGAQAIEVDAEDLVERITLGVGVTANRHCGLSAVVPEQHAA